ncbi:hypothetical protein WN50_03640 [Limnoraphis robusta CS-951]|uniref:Uncharacterized protein n=1 Tax=Limnoraphis robusta CS-951 TaxID=1637645 RepID=A0A0F5YL51_9CYAN|nr:hypothetical protein WN50_03640 [Limnoraphis robusta CS-951]
MKGFALKSYDAFLFFKINPKILKNKNSYSRSQETPRQETELKPLSSKDLTEKQCPNQRLRLL